MQITPATVATEYDWIRSRDELVVPILNDTRDALGDLFDTNVDHISRDRYRAEVDAIFESGEVAVNVAGYVGILRDLDVDDDYPGFVVDEILGRELAATIAGGHPLALLAQATFHFTDIHTRGPSEENAGIDDLHAALAAGFQTRLPGWSWREKESQFGVSTEME